MPPILALFAWPAVVLILAQKYKASLACILALVLGFLLLPVATAVDLPMLPKLNKYSVPALSVLLVMVAMGIGQFRGNELSLLPRHPFVRIAILAYVIGSFMTVVTNGDALHYGPRTLPGLRLYDGLSQILSALILLLPLLLARKFLARPEDHRLLLKVLSIAALWYSLPAIIELRMSPQFNNWVYGFFPPQFAQQVRAGGWRPVVFLGHGLILSLFLCMAILATAGVWRQEIKRRSAFTLALIFLFVVLLLSKSLGALMITIIFLPIAMFLRVRTQLIFATAIAAIAITYPMLRSAGVIPVDRIHSFAQQIDTARAASLQVRLTNEDILLRKAQARPAFGWGIWGRSRVFNTETGQDISISDGYWVIVIGVNGWVGYLSIFGLLCLPIGLILWRHREYGITIETAILTLILAANLIDLLPNSSLFPLTWMYAGALWGRLELGRIEIGAEKPDTEGIRPPVPFSRHALPDRTGQKEMVADTVFGADADGETARTPRYSRQKVQHERRRG